MSIARSWYHPAAITRSVMLRPRIYLGVLAGILAFAAGRGWPDTERLCMAWDAGALVYLFFAFRLMSRCEVKHIKTTVASGDDSRVVILSLILLSIGASFVAIAQLVVQAKLAAGDAPQKAFLAALAFLTIMISWSVTQVSFALHYAHEYYLPGNGSDAAGGLDFPACPNPDYWDFLYFSTSIGATSQTSDTAVRSRSLRRLVTVHAIIAFFFNTAVLALTVNIAASLAG